MSDKSFVQANAVAVARGGNSFAAASASSSGGSASAVAVAGSGYAFASAGCARSSTVSVGCRSFRNIPCKTRAQGVSLQCSGRARRCGNSALFMARHPRAMRITMMSSMVQSACGDYLASGGASDAGSRMSLFAMSGTFSGNGNQPLSIQMFQIQSGNNASGSSKTNKNNSQGSGFPDLSGQFPNMPKSLLNMAQAFAQAASRGKNNTNTSNKDDTSNQNHQDLYQKAFFLFLFLHFAQSFMGSKSGQ